MEDARILPIAVKLLPTSTQLVPTVFGGGAFLWKSRSTVHNPSRPDSARRHWDLLPSSTIHRPYYDYDS